MDLDSQTTKPAPVEACTVTDAAAHALASQRAARGTLSQETDKALLRTCTPPTPFASDDAMLSEQQKLIDAGQAPLNSFSLNPPGGSKDLQQYVENSLSALEDKLGQKMNYIWFQDDAGRAEIFLLGPSEKQTPSTQRSPGACTEIEDTVDNRLNQDLRLPSGTTEGEATKIYKDRTERSKLVALGIAADATPEEVKTIEADRARQLAALDGQQPAGTELSDENARALDWQKKAISIGLSPDTPPEAIQQKQNDYKQQAQAIMLGLNQYSSADEIADVQRQIDAMPDDNMNSTNGLPPGTSKADALAILKKRDSDSDLVRLGIDPSLSADQVHQIRQARNDRASELSAQIDSGQLSPDEAQNASLQIKAVQLGLPEDSTAETIAATKALYDQQASAVMLGLPKDASAEAIAAERDRSEQAENIPDNLCIVVPPLQ